MESLGVECRVSDSLIPRYEHRQSPLMNSERFQAFHPGKSGMLGHRHIKNRLDKL